MRPETTIAPVVRINAPFDILRKCSVGKDPMNSQEVEPGSAPFMSSLVFVGGLACCGVRREAGLLVEDRLD